MSPIPAFILALTGLGFLGFGAAAALRPSRAAAVTELSLPTPSARADFAATYGGFQVGFGLFLLVCARMRDWHEPGLWAAVAALAGFGVVRGVGILHARGRVIRAIWFGLGLEVAGVLLNLWALARVR
jgi:uncharacterized membrane protein